MTTFSSICFQSHAFVKRSENEDIDIGNWVCKVMNIKPNHRSWRTDGQTPFHCWAQTSTEAFTHLGQPSWKKKTTKWHVHPAKISLGICPVWSESLLSAWRSLRSLATHWAHCEDWSDWVDAQADPSLCWAHGHFFGFVMRQLIWASHHEKGTYHKDEQQKWAAARQNQQNDVHPAKTQISLLWSSESSLCAQDARFLYTDREDSIQTG